MIQQPAEFIAAPMPLAGLRIGISGAVPERQHWGKVVDLDRLVLTFVAQLSALVVRYGGQVVHGSQPLLTPVIAEQARRQLRESTEPLKLFASQVFGELPEVTERAARAARAQVILTAKIGPGDYRDPETRNPSLTAMRMAMTEQVDVLVAIGGKLHRDTGFNPGVLEELVQARWHRVPCFIVGAFGGAVGRLEGQLIEEFCAGNLISAESDMGDLARWTETMDEYVGKLLVHMVHHKDELKSQRVQNVRSIFRFVEKKVLVDKFSYTEGALHIDHGIIDKSLRQFKKLMTAIDQEDVGQARKLLQDVQV